MRGRRFLGGAEKIVGYRLKYAQKYGMLETIRRDMQDPESPQECVENIEGGICKCLIGSRPL